MGFNRAWRVMQALVLFAAIPQARAQGTVEDYQRAQSFLPGNLRHRVFLADVQANWIEKTSTFWYRRVGQTQTEFILVDAERNTSAPAFDHSRLAVGLSGVAKRAYDPSRLPFDSFEFVQSGKAIRLKTDDGLWICDVANYECRSSPPENPNEALSPNKQWSAYVKDHNLYLRNVSTGQTQPLTEDGVGGWDYATPLPSLRVLVEQGTENPRQAPQYSGLPCTTAKAGTPTWFAGDGTTSSVTCWVSRRRRISRSKKIRIQAGELSRYSSFQSKQPFSLIPITLYQLVIEPSGRK